MRTINLNKKQKGNSFIKAAALISFGGLMSKLLGVVYRIPLTNLLGSEGMGIYHMVFPFYTMLLAISSAGIPSAISRLIAEKLDLNDRHSSQSIFRSSLLVLGILGLILSIITFSLSNTVANIQSAPQAADCYKAIAPAVFFVALISVFRGYFQGNLNMLPTALSQIIEQIIKICFSLIVAISFLPDILKAVTYSILAVSVSEFVCLIYLVISYISFNRKNKKLFTKVKDENIISKKLSLKDIIKAFYPVLIVSIPVTIGSLILPLSQMIDSVLVVNILKTYYNGNVLSLYGLFSGPVNSVISLPVAICAGIAVAVIPYISASRVSGDTENIKSKIGLSTKLTFVIALPSALGLLFFAPLIMKMLYPRLPTNELNIASNLLKISIFSVVFLSLMQTSISILIALNKSFITTLNLLIAVVFKVVLNMILLRIPYLNIYGAAISAIICYFIASMLNILYLSKFKLIKFDLKSVFFKPFFASLISVAIAKLITILLNGFLPKSLILIIGVFISVILLFVFIIKFKILSDAELKMLPLFKKLIKDKTTEKKEVFNS